MWLIALLELSAWMGFTELKECSLLWVKTSPHSTWLGKTVHMLRCGWAVETGISAPTISVGGSVWGALLVPGNCKWSRTEAEHTLPFRGFLRPWFH